MDLTLTDSQALTWNHLVRTTMESMGGRAKLSDLGNALANLPRLNSIPIFESGSGRQSTNTATNIKITAAACIAFPMPWSDDKGDKI